MLNTNTDLKTGIKFGIISQNECLQAWADSSEPEYPEVEHDCDDPENCDCGEFLEPIGFSYIGDGYKAESDEYGDIWIFESPYYTLCRECSPCAPGAGYIMSQDDNGYKTYCFGHDWFDNNKAPYKVYDVKTNQEIKTE